MSSEKAVLEASRAALKHLNLPSLTRATSRASNSKAISIISEAKPNGPNNNSVSVSEATDAVSPDRTPALPAPSENEVLQAKIPAGISDVAESKPPRLALTTQTPEPAAKVTKPPPPQVTSHPLPEVPAPAEASKDETTLPEGEIGGPYSGIESVHSTRAARRTVAILEILRILHLGAPTDRLFEEVLLFE